MDGRPTYTDRQKSEDNYHTQISLQKIWITYGLLVKVINFITNVPKKSTFKII